MEPITMARDTFVTDDKRVADTLETTPFWRYPMKPPVLSRPRVVPPNTANESYTVPF